MDTTFLKEFSTAACKVIQRKGDELLLEALTEIKIDAIEGLPRNIALYGYKGTGKTTLARTFSFYNTRWKVLSFAQPIKDMVRVFLQSAGVSEMDINYYMTESKQEPVPNLGVTVRDLLGRMTGFHDWTEVMRNKVISINQTCGNIIVDDMRRPKEYYMLKERGFFMVRVYRTAVGFDAYDGFEGQLDDFKFDLELNIEGMKFVTFIRHILKKVEEISR